MKKLTIAVSLVGLMATAISAQPGPIGDYKAEAKERFRSFDRNNDGVVSHRELMNEASEKFSEFDQDRNGILVLDELPLKMPVPERVQRRVEQLQQRGERLRLGRGESGSGPAIEELVEKRSPTRMKFMARLDRDENEQLDVEEFAAPLIRRYKRADINGDGSVTEEEFDEALERGPRRKHRRGMRRGHG